MLIRAREMAERAALFPTRARDTSQEAWEAGWILRSEAGSRRHSPFCIANSPSEWPRLDAKMCVYTQRLVVALSGRQRS